MKRDPGTPVIKDQKGEGRGHRKVFFCKYKCKEGSRMVGVKQACGHCGPPNPADRLTRCPEYKKEIYSDEVVVDPNDYPNKDWGDHYGWEGVPPVR